MTRRELDYSTPVTFSFRQRLTLAVASTLISLAVRVLFSTCRVEIRNRHYHEEPASAERRVLLAFWHEVLPLAAWRYRNTGYHTLTSYSYDGELVARVVAKMGLSALRGSSSRGGKDALERMEAALNSDITIGLTLDGPRGPRRESKAGAAILGLRTGVCVIPTALAASRYWRLNSWDRMMLPKPFATLVCSYGPPIAPCRSDAPDAVEAKRKEIENALNAVQRELEQDMGVAL